MGRRAIEGRVRGNWRVNESTPNELSKIATMLGFLHGRGGATGKMLDAIASGDYVIVPKSVIERKSKNG
jgi:ERCC4-type nuclease